ncbi:AraC family transcriptional regulator [Pseudoteredinibacter isoporae]|uniref:AraC-like DNA-binding protein n=1 Tax=Pseudoteredinibacter isoporae TaxID=570281 RepID=A0A7X0JSY4_9GAMM|nr:AraC family transcriptional regulator [Pseudoteredinibacter isoporae]MBB6520840.1 AraC-like DNA-binding protein [Pseudoteredinibacter isoporae]NHO86405.1 AraC family transcriptional regulator [Pseudoteredinibacter isoporae]NIB25143.1 AraC family transcriptional regulator [Pseudoteredinibacter isoporae]
MANPRFPASYVAILSEMLKDYGHPTEPMLATVGLSNEYLDQPDASITDQQLRHLLETAAKISGDSALGLHFGQRLTLTSHGVVGYALMSCNNLFSALDLLMKYYRLLMNSAMLTIEQGTDHILLEHKNLGQDLMNPNFDEEIFSAGIVTAVRQLLHREKLPMELYFVYPEPEHVEEYHKTFDCPIHFEHHRNVIKLENNLLQEKPEFANPSMLKIYQQQCDKLLARLDDKADLSSSVRRMLISENSGFPKLEAMAEKFHMSPRTFRRRLQDEGNSFQKISDEVKRQLAEDYLRNANFSIETIASLVGFNDISNFRRAFIRWTGESPASFQKRQRP